MRRKTPGVLSTAELASDEIGDPARVIRVLEPLALERRCEKLKSTVDQRVESVQVFFDAPHDPFNGAAVLRSCEAFGVQRIHVIERVERFLAASSVARGAQKWVDIYPHKSAASAIEAARSANLEMIGAHPEGELLPEDLANVPRVALVLGNERDGITEELERACSRRVRVPMRGFVESLNVSVTAAILLSAATKHRPGDLDEVTKQRLYALGLYATVNRAREILAAAK